MPRAKEILPFMNLYGRDLFTDPLVEVMTTEQVGAHCLLIFRSWFETPGGSVPNNDSTLARWVQSPSIEQWNSYKDGVLAAWFLKGDRWFQKRVVQEFRNAVLKQRKARESAAARWEKEESRRKANDMRTHSDGNANRTDQNRSEQTLPPKPPNGGRGGTAPRSRKRGFSERDQQNADAANEELDRQRKLIEAGQ